MSEHQPWTEIHRRGWPRLLLRFSEVNGRFECVAIEVGPPRPGQKPVPLTAQTFRDIPWGHVIAEARSRIADDILAAAKTGRLHGLALSEQQRVEARRGRSTASRTRRHARSGRPTQLDENHFLNVALAVVDAHRRGISVEDALQDRWGPIAKGTVGKWVSRARNEFGFLMKTTKGKREPRLTAKARRRLREREET